MRYSTWALFFIVILLVITGGVAGKNRLVSYIGRVTGWNICGDVSALQRENEVLRRRVSALTATSSDPIAEGGIVARIHASYPFNNTSIISVDVGALDGVRLFMPATIGGQIVVGHVVKVFAHYSLVRTVFSPDWQLPVRIGHKKIPGLLTGGPTVRVSMIESGKTIRIGDVIVTAGREIPFGLSIGAVDVVRADTAAGVFQEATVVFSYALTDLTELVLLTWTPE